MQIISVRWFAPFFVFPAQWTGSGTMCCSLRSILACVRNLCYRVGKGKWLKVSCLSCERKRISEWLEKTLEISQKTWEIFQKTLEIILKMSNVFSATSEKIQMDVPRSRTSIVEKEEMNCAEVRRVSCSALKYMSQKSNINPAEIKNTSCSLS